MITKYRKYESYENLPRYGNILLTTANSSLDRQYIMLDVLRTDVYIYSYHKNEVMPVVTMHLDNAIKDGKILEKDVKEVFKKNPQLVVDLYMGLQNAENFYKEINSEQLFELWNRKLPELKYHLESNKYNL